MIKIADKFLTEWERTLQNKTLQGIGVANFQLSPENFKWLKQAVKDAKKEGIGNQDKLIGHIKEEYKITKWTPEFELFLCQCTTHPWFSKFLWGFDVLSEPKPWYLDTLWVNYQKKHEFNPLHDHTGVFSFIIFVDIPYDLKKEDKYFSGISEKNEQQLHTSRLTFVNNRANGGLESTLVNVDKSFTGKMFMFSAKQSHIVYPFYTSDGYRITVSGNIKLKV
jgi:hypothetical protein